MRTSIYIACWIIVFGFGMLPLVPAIGTWIASVIPDNVIMDTYFIKITFKSSNIPGLLSIAIILVGSLLNYCIYKGGTCYWRREHVKDVHFVPGIYNDEDVL